MADSVWGAASAAAVPTTTVRSRHSAVVRVTHWITTLAFLASACHGSGNSHLSPALLLGGGRQRVEPSVIQTADSGLQIHRAHRLRLRASRSERLEPLSSFPIGLGGRTNRLTVSLFRIRYRPFTEESASRSRRALASAIVRHLRFRPARAEDAWSYNAVQRLTYLIVIFGLFPLVIWTGLAMSPAIASAIPAAVTILGGQQSARTLHFFVSVLLVLFLVIHVVMVALSGFRNRMGAMVTGRPAVRKEGT